MECRHGNFWIGLGIGSILGAVAYRLSRTAKARQLESDIYNAIHRIGRDAEIAAAEAERKAMNLGLKAVETGAKVADKVAEEADKAVGKAKEKFDIRKAQQEYRSLHHGMYTEHFDTLIDFVKNQKLPFVMKVGQLTDDQLESGLTEKKAMAIINKAKKTGKYDEVKKNGLENFKRDTMWVAVMDTIYPKGFNADSMKYIPYGNGAIFEMNVKNDTAKSGAPVYLFEVKAPYETYLGGLDRQEIINLKDLNEKLGRYSGLMVGSIDNPNNGAGNWE